jgi:RNA polymerase sigma-70 factor (ECF subfamily)
MAEDLVQETLLAALQSRDRFQGRSTVRTWLLSILRRKVVDHYRRLGESRPAQEVDSIEGPDPIRDRYFNTRGLWRTGPASWKTPDRALEDREFWDVLEGCLRRLPRALSSVFVLRELEELEMTELRQTLALSEGNIRVRLHRARLLLRECLERRWFAEAHAGSKGEP